MSHDLDDPKDLPKGVIVNRFNKKIGAFERKSPQSFSNDNPASVLWFFRLGYRRLVQTIYIGNRDDLFFIRLKGTTSNLRYFLLK